MKTPFWIFLLALTLISTVHGLTSKNSTVNDTFTAGSHQRVVRVKKVRIDLTTIDSTPTSTVFPNYTIDNAEVSTQISKRRRKKVIIPVFRTKTVYRIKAKKDLPNGHSYHKENPEKGAKYHAKSTDKVLLTRKPLTDYDDRQTPKQSRYEDSTGHGQAQLDHTEEHGAKITPDSGHTVIVSHHGPVNEATSEKKPVMYRKKAKKRLKKKEQEEVSKKVKKDYEKDKPFFPDSYYPASDYFSKEPENNVKESKPKYSERYTVELTTKPFPNEISGYNEPKPYSHEDEVLPIRKTYHRDAPSASKSYHHDASPVPKSSKGDASQIPKLYHHDPPREPKLYYHDPPREPKLYHHDPPRKPKLLNHDPPREPKLYQHDSPKESKSDHHDAPEIQTSYHHDISGDKTKYHQKKSPQSSYHRVKKHNSKYNSKDTKNDYNENGEDLSVNDVPPVPEIKKGGRGPRFSDDYDIPPPPQSRPIYIVQRPPAPHYSSPEPHYYSAPRPRPQYVYGPPPPPPTPYPNQPPHHEPYKEPYLPPNPAHQPPVKHYYTHVHEPQPVLVPMPKPYMRNPSPYLGSSEEDSPERPRLLHRLPTLHERRRLRKYPKNKRKPYYHGADGPVYKAPGYSKEDDENNSGSKSNEEDEKNSQIDEPEDEFEKDFERVRLREDNSIKDGEREVHVYGPVKTSKKTREDHQQVHGPVLLRPKYSVPVYYSRPRLIVRPKHHHHHVRNLPPLRPPPSEHKYAVKEVHRPQSSLETDPKALGFSTAFADFISKLRHFERLYV